MNSTSDLELVSYLYGKTAGQIVVNEISIPKFKVMEVSSTIGASGKTVEKNMVNEISIS